MKGISSQEEMFKKKPTNIIMDLIIITATLSVMKTMNLKIIIIIIMLIIIMLIIMDIIRIIIRIISYYLKILIK